MKIESQLLDDHQIKLKVEIEPEPLELAKRRAAREIAKRAKIPGFRPGKAPYHVVERYAGPNVIFADALELLVKELYPKAIEESQIKPYGPGTLVNVPSQESPILEFVVPLEAEVDLGDYRSIRIPHETKTVSEEDINAVIENMRQQQAIIEPVERPAQETDLVTIKLRAERKQVEEGEVPTLIRERSIPVIIQPDKKDENQQAAPEWPFPGFSRHLVGLRVGDERTITYTFPEDSSFEMLRGKDAEYHFVVESVKSRTLPELNDEFAYSQGEYENLQALLAEVRSKLEQQMAEQEEAEYNDKILSALLNVATVKYPPQMVEEEIHSLIHDLENRLAQQKMDLETYLKTRQMDREALEKEYAPTAEARLKRFLVLYEVAKQENIQVQEEEVQAITAQTLQEFSKSLSPEQARKGFSNAFIQNLSRSISADLLIRDTMKRLRAIAQNEFPAAGESVAEPTSVDTQVQTISENTSDTVSASLEAEEPVAIVEKIETTESTEPSRLISDGDPNLEAET